MRRIALALAALALAAAGVPPLAPPPPPPPPPPPLVIVITVEQFSSALFERYRPVFTGGLGRLARGTVFRNGRDEAAAESFGSILKRRSPDSQHIVVGGDDSVAAKGAELVDQRWYWTGGVFASDAPRPPLPRTIGLANAAVARLIATPEAGLEQPASCPGPAGGRQFARAAGDRAAFTASPALDGATLALAAGLIGELGLGRDRAPDVVSVDLAGTGNVGSRAGAGPSDGTCLQLLSLDRDLGAFFDTLDRAGLYYAVALSGADSTVQRGRIPILLWRAGMVPTERLEPAATSDVVPTLAAMLGMAVPGHCLPAQGVVCSQP